MSLRAETNFPAGIYQGLTAPSPSMPPVFSFEFLVDKNTCGDCNVWSGSWRFTINQYKLLHQKNLGTLGPHPGRMSCTNLNYDPNQSFSFLWIKHWGPTLFDKGFNLHSFFSSFWLWCNWTAPLFLHRHLCFGALVSVRTKCSAFYFQQFTSWICSRLFWPESTLLEKIESSSSYIFGVIHFFWFDLLVNICESIRRRLCVAANFLIRSDFGQRFVDCLSLLYLCR